MEHIMKRKQFLSLSLALVTSLAFQPAQAMHNWFKPADIGISVAVGTSFSCGLYTANEISSAGQKILSIVKERPIFLKYNLYLGCSALLAQLAFKTFTSDDKATEKSNKKSFVEAIAELRPSKEAIQTYLKNNAKRIGLGSLALAGSCLLAYKAGSTLRTSIQY